MNRRTRHARRGWTLLPAALACGVGAAACTEANPAYYPGIRPGPAADGAVVEPWPPDAAAADAGGDAGAVDLAAPSPDVALMPLDTAARSPDVASPDGAPDVGPDAPPAGCGTERPNIGTLANVDGLVVTPDGSMYFTTTVGNDAWVGRWPAGGSLEREWLGILNAPVTWGLALDNARQRLYVASASGMAILVFQIAANPIVGQILVPNVPEPNDVQVAADGSVYYSEQRSGNVYRVAGTGGTPQRVNSSAFAQQPAGLAFAADGSLYVGLRAGGGVWRLGLNAAGTERDRERFGATTTWANGLAFDRAGRLYVATYSDTAPAQVLRFQPDGSGQTEVLGGGRFSTLTFGRGRLDCFDLYATEPFGPLHRIRVDVPGLSLP